MDEDVVLRRHLKPSLTRSRKSSMGPIEDLVQCNICLDRLSQPKMLACQHTFCLVCLLDMFSNGTVNYHCPTCKKRFPAKNLAELPNNLYIDSLLKLVVSNSDGQISVDKVFGK